MLRNTMIAITMLILVSLINSPLSLEAQKGLVIVVTFPSISKDIERIVCKDDIVVSIVPPGADPHTYQLLPKDIDIIKKADIVVSLAHAPHELRIKELIQRKELDVKLIEIPYIPGIEILTNPVTKNPNYHMPIYDPQNYIVFIRYLGQELSKLRPECATMYMKNVDKVINEIKKLISKAPKFNVSAVGDTPLVQYAVKWLGIDIAYLLVKEYGIPITPQDISNIKNLLRDKARIVIVTEGKEKASEKLLEIANEMNVPVLSIPSPLSNMSMIERLSIILERVKELNPRSLYIESTTSMFGTQMYIVMIIVLIVLIAIAIALRVRRGRRS